VSAGLIRIVMQTNATTNAFGWMRLITYDNWIVWSSSVHSLDKFCQSELGSDLLTSFIQNQAVQQENTSNLSKAHQTRDSLAVPVCRLSWSISIHFVAIHS